MDYLTLADADVLLGAGWAIAPGAEERAVMMANAWLSERIRREVGLPVPQAILNAGAEIAREAADGKVFAAAPREVTSATVSAGGGVSSSKTFAAGSAERSPGEVLALSLIAPWTRRPGTIRLVRA